MKNKTLLIGLLTIFISLIVFYILFSIKYSFKWWEHEQYLLYFIPIWSVAFGICSYSFSKKFIQKKRIHFPIEKPTNYNVVEAQKQWRWEKNSMLQKACVIGRNIFGISIPIYVLAYVDKSVHIKSNWFMITFFLVATSICFILERKLKKNYITNQSPVIRGFFHISVRKTRF